MSDARTWETLEGPLRLARGCLEVWLADLTAPGAQAPERISPEERARKERFASRVDGVMWARAHGLLRTLLGGYLQCDPLAVSFSYGPQGKPALDAGEQLHFNLSHSGELALLAFSRDAPVGVDVEVERGGGADVLGVASRMLGAERARELEQLEPAARSREFLRSWTRHEAALKCRGSGIGAAAASGEDERGLWVEDLDAGPGAAGAVAMAAPPAALRLLRWPG
jgi:4'-phosphopantetheinyl transferase